MKILIYRYNPESDIRYRMQTYEVDLNKFQGIMLLDLLIYIKENIDNSLSFRKSCREGVCGSDAMNINGKNGLSCITLIKNLGKNVILRPLPGIEIVRDLVVDLKVFYDSYRKILPYIIYNNEIDYRLEKIQSFKSRLKLNGLYECILCGCCTSACPSFWWNKNKFLGPAAILQSARFIYDSRDELKYKRLNLLDDQYSVFKCRSIMNCTYVCPKKLNPSRIINLVKIEILKNNL